MYDQYLDKVEDKSTSVFQKTMESGEYELVGGFGSADAIMYVAQYLNSKILPDGAVVTQLLGSPGSGKSRFSEAILPLLTRGIPLATDEYNLGTREDRKKTIEKGGTSLDEKDFALLSRHVSELKELGEGQKMMLPPLYDVATGSGLIQGLTREVIGAFKIIFIEGNFYVGRGGASDVNLDQLIYIHISDRNRLNVRLIRDLITGQARGKSPDEIFEQFAQRQKIQDLLYTLPFMDLSDLLLYVKPVFEGESINRFDYEIYSRKTKAQR